MLEGDGAGAVEEVAGAGRVGEVDATEGTGRDETDAGGGDDTGALGSEGDGRRDGDDGAPTGSEDAWVEEVDDLLGLAGCALDVLLDDDAVVGEVGLAGGVDTWPQPDSRSTPSSATPVARPGIRLVCILVLVIVRSLFGRWSRPVATLARPPAQSRQLGCRVRNRYLPVTWACAGRMARHRDAGPGQGPASSAGGPQETLTRRPTGT